MAETQKDKNMENDMKTGRVLGDMGIVMSGPKYFEFGIGEHSATTSNLDSQPLHP